jgi:hypothetical protein
MRHEGKQKRKGGKKRQRTKRRTSALHRDDLPNAPLPRHRQPAINNEMMVSRLAASPEFADALELQHAELRKSRLHLDEIVRLLKAGTDPASISNIIESAVEECRVTFVKGRETLGKQFYTMAEEASGPKRLNRRAPS